MTKKRSKRKLKKDNILIICLFVILIILVISLLIMGKNIFSGNKKAAKEAKIVDKLESYDYYLTDNNTKYYRGLFDDLKKTLNKEDIDEEAYATLVAKLFTADFYDLNSKISKTDVGGTQFILKAYRNTFIQTATDINGIYYYVDSNIYGKRNQELPVVEDVEVVSLKNMTYKYKVINDEKAYKIDVKITYKEDLDYPKSVSLVLIHNDNKLEIVEVS